MVSDFQFVEMDVLLCVFLKTQKSIKKNTGNKDRPNGINLFLLKTSVVGKST